MERSLLAAVLLGVLAVAFPGAAAAVGTQPGAMEKATREPAPHVSLSCSPLFLCSCRSCCSRHRHQRRAALRPPHAPCCTRGAVHREAASTAQRCGRYRQGSPCRCLRRSRDTHKVHCHEESVAVAASDTSPRAPRTRRTSADTGERVRKPTSCRSSLPRGGGLRCTTASGRGRRGMHGECPRPTLLPCHRSRG
ncbi:uncharacterized protein LOC127778245 [Oryza glaberrima]|uniref:uncharacterized protein LOC127778245 n=1 Tax=Oryza glaberrima TaxID=4538 RepID=UPI00224C4007|nr:uncharacterized protein LOC127778245 [Oryza glaberrima]